MGDELSENLAQEHAQRAAADQSLAGAITDAPGPGPERAAPRSADPPSRRRAHLRVVDGVRSSASKPAKNDERVVSVVSDDWWTFDDPRERARVIFRRLSLDEADALIRALQEELNRRQEMAAEIPGDFVPADSKH